MLQEQMAQNLVQEMAQEPLLKTATKPEHLVCLEEKGNQEDFFKRFPTSRFWISNKL